MFDLRLLVEEDDKKQKEEKSKDSSAVLNSIQYGAQPSRRRPRNEITDANSRAVKEPAALLKDLGINELSGESSISKLASAIEQATKNNATFGESFSSPKTYNTDDGPVVLIKPFISKERYPHIYIGAITLALQKTGALPDDLQPEVRKSRLPPAEQRKMNIMQANDGTIVIADFSWHNKKDNERKAKRKARNRRKEKERKEKEEKSNDV